MEEELEAYIAKVADLRGKIEECQMEIPNSGYRPVEQYLKRKGFNVGERRIRRVMKDFSMQALVRRAFVVTTDSNHSNRVYPNHIAGMTITGSNQVWAVSKRIDGNLTLAALRMVVTRRKPSEGVIHHSDRGVRNFRKLWI